jgi:polysaccharide biosynthesis/export protein
MKRAASIAAMVVLTINYLHAQSGNQVPTARTVSPRVSTSNSSTSIAGLPEDIGIENDQRVAQAMTTSDYPVTPGDTYALSFVTSAGPVLTTLVVDVGYSISIPNIGIVDGRGMRLVELKAIVEKRVLEAYPQSSPRLYIKSCGVFPAFVRGEVPAASIVYLWGLSRLSDLWKGVTPYASNRDVEVRSIAGSSKTYDLYKAGRAGDLDQDPRLRPGDTVTFYKYSRQVYIEGEVRRPGKYQLLPSESLDELIKEYADGLTTKADASRLRIVRVHNGKSSVGETMLIDLGKNPNLALMDGDSVSVPPMQDNLPVVYFEGALGIGVEGAVLDASRRINYTFFPGETLSQASQKLRDQFSSVSDLSSAYVQRGNEKIPINIADLLYSKDYKADIALSPNDVVIVPFRQLFVFVSGAVMVPGRYPYIPDRRWDYYISVAGGFDQEKNSKEKVSILDQKGKVQAKDRLIAPEDTIIAAENNALYIIGKFATITSTAISAMALIVSLIRLQ